MSNIKKIAVGDNFVPALDFDGHLWTWGVNNYGQTWSRLGNKCSA